MSMRKNKGKKKCNKTDNLLAETVRKEAASPLSQNNKKDM